MKFILVAIMAYILTACSMEVAQTYRISMCPKDGDGCRLGDVSFNSKEECDEFVAKAAEAQPNIMRFCTTAY